MRTLLRAFPAFWFGVTALAAAGHSAVLQQPSAPPVDSSRPAAQVPQEDWPNLGAYRQQNNELAPPTPAEDRVVFLGDSITYAWSRQGRSFFPGKPYLNRGIKGQTTPQLLVRFRQDVIALEPKAVVILAGTNDIAGNTGPATLGMIEDNLMSMTELARANNIRVILCSVLPASDYPWRPGLQPARKIVELNAWIKRYAQDSGIIFADYYSALADGEGGLKADFSADGVHPNDKGYEVMRPLAEQAIVEALKRGSER